MNIWNISNWIKLYIYIKMKDAQNGNVPATHISIGYGPDCSSKFQFKLEFRKILHLREMNWSTRFVLFLYYKVI